MKYNKGVHLDRMKKHFINTGGFYNEFYIEFDGFLEKHCKYGDCNGDFYDCMSGNQITVRTLDLNLPFSEIAEQLNMIVMSHFDLSR